MRKRDKNKKMGQGDIKKQADLNSLLHPGKGHTPRQLMNRHIRDEHDIITDEDFMNLDIGPGLKTGENS